MLDYDLLTEVITDLIICTRPIPALSSFVPSIPRSSWLPSSSRIRWCINIDSAPSPPDPTPKDKRGFEGDEGDLHREVGRAAEVVDAGDRAEGALELHRSYSEEDLRLWKSLGSAKQISSY